MSTTFEAGSKPVAPHLLAQLVAGQHLRPGCASGTRAARTRCRSARPPAVDPRPPGRRCRGSARPPRSPRAGPAAAPAERAQAGPQLAQRERLDQVVVGAGVEARRSGRARPLRAVSIRIGTPFPSSRSGGRPRCRSAWAAAGRARSRRGGRSRALARPASPSCADLDGVAVRLDRLDQDPDQRPGRPPPPGCS